MKRGDLDIDIQLSWAAGVKSHGKGMGLPRERGEGRGRREGHSLPGSCDAETMRKGERPKTQTNGRKVGGKEESIRLRKLREEKASRWGKLK